MKQKISNLIYKIISKIIVKLVGPQLASMIQEGLSLKSGYGWGTSSVKHEVKMVLQLLGKDTSVNPVIFDIGANIGEYTSSVIDHFPDSQIYCFEPNKNNNIVLVERFSNFSNVKVINLAFGNENKDSNLYSDYDGSPLGSLTKRNLQHLNINFNHTEQIKIMKLDDWVKINNVQPTILKMDVEGHEFDILKGGIETIKRAKIVQFEFGGANIDTRTYFLDFFMYFRELNFEIYIIKPSGVNLISEYHEKCEFFSTTNFIAVSKKYN
jgi:FkbM family methyltransferase